MTASSAARLLREVGLEPQGPVVWGAQVPCEAPGVYVIETPGPLPEAPIDPAAVAAWIARVDTLRLDGGRPSPQELARRLEAWWMPGETVVYVGLAGTSVASRMRQFYRTPLGDPRPHAGGHWLKTLNILDSVLVWWAEATNPSSAERELLTAFTNRHGSGSLPFANRVGATGLRKAHGITGSTLRTARAADATATTISRLDESTSRHSVASADMKVAQINAAIQRVACAGPEKTVRAVDAARELDRLGTLRDSAHRPGLPLRNLLRAGKIQHAYQEAGRWFLGCADDCGTDSGR